MMNNELLTFARSRLKELLLQCTEPQRHFFKRMYAGGQLDLDIEVVVDSMSEEKLDWAMMQCQNTLKGKR